MIYPAGLAARTTLYISEYHTQLATMRIDEIFDLTAGLYLYFWVDDKKRYTATIPRHRAVQQNTPRFLAPIRDADWSTQPRTGF